MAHFARRAGDPRVDEVEIDVSDLPDDVDAYRASELIRFGLDVERAVEYAPKRAGIEGGYLVDLHVFEGLTKAGATPDQALRILG